MSINPCDPPPPTYTHPCLIKPTLAQTEATHNATHHCFPFHCAHHTPMSCDYTHAGWLTQYVDAGDVSCRWQGKPYWVQQGQEVLTRSPAVTPAPVPPEAAMARTAVSPTVNTRDCPAFKVAATLSVATEAFCTHAKAVDGLVGERRKRGK